MARNRPSLTAIIYDKRGKVLSIGKNSFVKTHPLQKRHADMVGLPEKKYLHAEMSAIIKCKAIDKAHKIVVYRFAKDGKEANARPCPVCMSAINAAGIKHIEHT